MRKPIEASLNIRNVAMPWEMKRGEPFETGPSPRSLEILRSATLQTGRFYLKFCFHVIKIYYGELGTKMVYDSFVYIFKICSRRH